jgi:type 1 glutamine amidotransferase
MATQPIRSVTISRRQFALSSLAFLAASAPAASSRGQQNKPIRVLIVDGINNHDWVAATHGIAAILTNAGLFSVGVSTTPPRGATPEAWNAWKPAFADYDVVINNFNGGHLADGIEWPPPVQHALAQFVRSGGGLVVYHAANNTFPAWKDYNDMIGLGWRPPSYGPGLAVADDGAVIVIPKGAGLEPGHPPRLDFQIHVRDTRHPITAGMPTVWMHPSEQLTHGQHGPAEGLTILTYAHSPVSQQNEPMDWVRNYGNGRVYTTMLGHTWAGEPSPNLDCVGFQTLLARGVEWAATGTVTLPIPANFPGPEKVSLHMLT